MLLILMGKSGAGKDSVLRELVKEYDFVPMISTTSRPIREGEKDGVDYNFITREDFLNRIENSAFLEYRSYNTLVDNKPDTWYYGSPKYALEKGKDYVKVLDPTGAETFIKHYGKENCFVVYIDVKDEVREERAAKRGSFNKPEWDRRVKDDNERFSKYFGKEGIPLINYETDNNDTNSVNPDISVEELANDIACAYEAYEQTIKNEYKGKYGTHPESNIVVWKEIVGRTYYDPGEEMYRVHDLYDDLLMSKYEDEMLEEMNTANKKNKWER